MADKIKFSLDINPEKIAALRALLLRSAHAEIALERDGSTRNATADWSEHESDMRLLSALFPTPVFSLKGISDDGSQFIKYFRNGLMQATVATITFPPFDPAQLH